MKHKLSAFFHIRVDSADKRVETSEIRAMALPGTCGMQPLLLFPALFQIYLAADEHDKCAGAHNRHALLPVKLFLTGYLPGPFDPQYLSLPN
jgi:hypothetical protein